MESLFLTFLNMSITASLVVGAVLLLRLCLKKAPKWISYALWALVFFRLVCPVSFSAPVSLLGAVQAPATGFGKVDYVQALEQGAHAGDPAQVWTERPNQASTDTELEKDAPVPLRVGWRTVAAWAWLGGAFLMLAYSALSYTRLKRRVREAVRTEDGAYETDAVASPFVLGLLCPKIYMPLDLSGSARDLVLAHERCHIRRRDYLVKPFAFLALSLHWFNPVIWLAFRLCCKDMEMSCDERVIRDMDGPERVAYGQALLALSMGRPILAGSPLAFGESGTKGRVKNVLNYKKPAFWLTLAALALCLGVGIFLLANPWAEHDPAVVVGPYAHAYADSDDPAYAMGVNAYGMPVFVDTSAAFEAMYVDCTAGIAYLQNTFDLAPLTKWDYEVCDAYKSLAAQSGAEDAETRRQCGLISNFFDIYENSFRKVVADAGSGDGIYKAGALVGESAYLSAYFPDGSMLFDRIALSHYRLTVTSSEGEDLYADGGAAQVHAMTRPALLQALEENRIILAPGAQVPEYRDLDDMAVYSYYAPGQTADDPEAEVLYSIYWFNGEPRWIAQGEMLRIYALEKVSD